jgi:hypothetical protein
MRPIVSVICLSLLFATWINTSHAANSSPEVITLIDGWRVTQDVRDLGEKIGWYEPDFVRPDIRELAGKTGHKPDYAVDWQPIDRLVHLQLLLAAQPYFGRNLRYFNDAPWWYRLEFATPEAARKATLRFEGVDYFAKVWLNGTLLGEHEGYADPFGFEVGALLRKDRPNVLVVKVSSPWDHDYTDPTRPTVTGVRILLKGSYEHADTFVQRDVNPVGIWKPVELLLHDELRESDIPAVTSSLSQDQKQATLKVAWWVFNEGEAADVRYIVQVRSKDTEERVATSTQVVRLESGDNALETTVTIPSPRLWRTWDRGSQPLYEASLQLMRSGSATLSSSVTFGIRTVELRRNVNETRFFINGKPLYLRGTTYWPDLYLSNMDRTRYERDIRAAVHAGLNAIRVHVHTENPEFYAISDRLGIVVIQDNDLNWMFPTDQQFSARAVQHFGTMVKLLRNHPSVIAWVAMNEVFWGEGKGQRMIKGRTKSDAKAVGSQLVGAAHELDPTRPVIEDSGISNDLASGDSHDYRGSLNGGASTYFDIDASSGDVLGSPPKLVTEFGVDAPPAISSLRAVPAAAERRRDVLPRVAELHDYQYHQLKHYIEYYRMQKYSPNAGYFQFMWIDFSPQSFYGIYDYWGVAKTEGLGGGLRALEESNQPIGIFMQHTTMPRSLYAVNDTAADLGSCIARWRVTASEIVVAEGAQPVKLGPDSLRKISDFRFSLKPGETYKVVLELSASDGKTLAHNIYINPCQLQPRPSGYPDRVDDELGMRLWWADDMSRAAAATDRLSP